ncbi:hypothetical protein [Dictyobacter arantiisoli]|uniref:Uncharacterized protein n=1 Tax=Dictyobacter arantiisoli TaxID=2014874 RepID=A0A5A5TIB8_9CHLR|nr:hypothetical protein [Dictyobacter arantiisoli]GCF10803.1 hypothetical protein KDI_43670 [Dictyobacter arantiisoli]
MEQKQHRLGYDDFAEQFVSVLSDHWSDIIRIIERQSPRVSSLLRVAIPTNLKRINGTWRIQIAVRRISQRDGLQSPRDNEIVAQAIRLWAHSEAQFRLPRITIEFVI